MSRGLVVSLDGPASSGKSSAGAGAAHASSATGSSTPACSIAASRGWPAIVASIPRTSTGCVALIPDMQVVPDELGQLRHIRVDGEDVTELLHSADVEATVSQVARQERVRSALLPVQRELAADGRIIMAGRDIGTVVLPDADLKLYLEVSVAERARRRAAERGIAPDSAEVARARGRPAAARHRRLDASRRAAASA